MPVTLEDPTHAGQVYQGKVSRVGVAGDPATHTFPVQVRVPGGKDGPRPGQVVRATVKLATHAGALTVPEDALANGALFVVRDRRARRVAVSVGPRVGRRRIIASGLKAGDAVVVVGVQGLEDGTAVEVVAQDAKPGRPSGSPNARPSGSPSSSPNARPSSSPNGPPIGSPNAPPSGR